MSQHKLLLVVALVVYAVIIQINLTQSCQDEPADEELGLWNNLRGAKTHTRIFNGTLVPPGKYPFQAFVIIRTSNTSFIFCGGVIIDERHILTAAHCLNHCDGGTGKQLISSVSDVSVALGEHSTIDDTDDNVKIGISKLTIHEEYNSCDIFNRTISDIALLKTKEPIRFVQTPNGCG